MEKGIAIQQETDKSGSAYEHIKEMILDGTLMPGTDISDKKLQEALGVSRTPIREALRRLQDEKFVLSYPRKGTFVTDVTMETVRDLYETRLLVEPYMSRNAVDIVSRDWLEGLKHRLCEEHSMRDHTDILAVMSLDTELHTVIAERCPNSFLRDSLRLVYEHDRRIRLKTEQNPGQVSISRGEHIAIVDALLAGDRDEVERLSRAHVIHSRDMTYISLGFLRPDQ